VRTILGCMVVFAMACSLAAADEQIDFKMLLGKWELAEAKKGQAMSLEFAADSKITALIGDPGKEVKVEGTYRPIENNKLDVSLKHMGEDFKETLIIRKLTDDELVTEDSKGKSEMFRKKK
jgi:uncharacterized protein (TIGR03066 family)